MWCAGWPPIGSAIDFTKGLVLLFRPGHGNAWHQLMIDDENLLLANAVDRTHNLT